MAMTGVRVTASPHLTIEDCTFAFAPGDKTPIAGGALMASTDCTSLSVRRNRFVCGGNIAETRTTFGVLITAGDNQAPLDDCDISDNLFAGLGLPVGALGPFGLVSCCDNRVRQCAAGFFLLALVIPTASAGRTAADRRMLEATRLPMSPAMLVSVAESVKQAAAQPAGAKTAAAGANDAAAAPAAPPVAVAANASIDAILDALDQQIASAVLGGQPPRAVMHVRNNDIELSAAASASGN